MDADLALIDARVAEAAEAWLSDPRDAGVYARLVLAVQTRRRHLDATTDRELTHTRVPARASGAPGSDSARPCNDADRADPGRRVAADPGPADTVHGDQRIATPASATAAAGLRPGREERAAASDGQAAGRDAQTGVSGAQPDGGDGRVAGTDAQPDGGDGRVARADAQADGGEADSSQPAQVSQQAPDGDDPAPVTREPESAEAREDVAIERSWPAVRAVGSDLDGDPAAVLRRLRGG